MFLENTINHNKRSGWIEIICGSMFSGKTEELIRRLKRAQIAQQKTEIFKPEIDTRYHKQNVVSHDAKEIHSTPVKTSHDILKLAEGVEVVGIDEAQFFDEGLVNVCTTLANNGTRVILAGLDMDYTGKPFGPMPVLLSIAEYVTKVHAICVDCGNLANHSHRITKNEGQVMLGEKDHYEALCRNCFEVSKPSPLPSPAGEGEHPYSK